MVGSVPRVAADGIDADGKSSAESLRLDGGQRPVFEFPIPERSGSDSGLFGQVSDAEPADLPERPKRVSVLPDGGCWRHIGHSRNHKDMSQALVATQ